MKKIILTTLVTFSLTSSVFANTYIVRGEHFDLIITEKGIQEVNKSHAIEERVHKNFKNNPDFTVVHLPEKRADGTVPTFYKNFKTGECYKENGTSCK